VVASNPARGVLNFVVTLTTHKDVRSYPCRSMESAIKLAERFIAGVTKPRPVAPVGQSGAGRVIGDQCGRFEGGLIGDLDLEADWKAESSLARMVRGHEPDGGDGERSPGIGLAPLGVGV
jgi:hypothetical protein